MGYLRHKATGETVIGTAEVQHFTQRIANVRALEWGEWEWGDDIRPMESETETDPADEAPLLVLASGATCKLAECELVAVWEVSGRNRKVGAIGSFERFSVEVEASSEAAAIEAARAERYADGFDHVDQCRAKVAADSPFLLP